MLALDINGAKQSVVNSGELAQDAHSKKNRLLGKTQEYNRELEQAKDELKLHENEVHKARSSLKRKKDQHMDLVVDEKMLEDQVDKKQETIESLKKERKETLEAIENTKREILLKREKTSGLSIDVSYRSTKCRDLDAGVRSCTEQIDALKP